MITERQTTQTEKIKEVLLKGGSITPLDALQNFGCMRLGARIWELIHKQGFEIVGEMVQDGDKSYKKYTLKKTLIKKQIREWLKSGKGISLESARYKIDENLSDVMFRIIIEELREEFPIDDDGYGRFTMNLNVPIEL